MDSPQAVGRNTSAMLGATMRTAGRCELPMIPSHTALGGVKSHELTLRAPERRTVAAGNCALRRIAPLVSQAPPATCLTAAPPSTRRRQAVRGTRSARVQTSAVAANGSAGEQQHPRVSASLLSPPPKRGPSWGRVTATYSSAHIRTYLLDTQEAWRRGVGSVRVSERSPCSPTLLRRSDERLVATSS
jgi:hypothetical protein